MDAGSNGEEPKSWDELYSIDLMPSELFLKFREELQGFRLGLNLEVSYLYFIVHLLISIFLKFHIISSFYSKTVILFQFYNAPMNECQAKLVVKPLSNERRWKFIYEPLHHDIRLVSKKIPLTKFLNLQV